VAQETHQQHTPIVSASSISGILGNIWQEFGRMKKRLLLRLSCCDLLSNHYLCGNQKQDHYEKCKNT
jgi:hypothetical protein